MDAPGQTSYHSPRVAANGDAFRLSDLPRLGGDFLSAEKTMETKPLSRTVYIVLISAAFAYVVFWYGYAINAIVAAR